MSRKGVIAKRVKTGPGALSRNRGQAVQTAGRGTNVPRSAKVQTIRPCLGQSSIHRPITSRPGKQCPAVGHATTNAAHDHAARAGKQRLAAARPTHVPRRCAVRAGKPRPRPAKKHRPIFTVRPQPADQIIRPRPFRSATTRSGRPSRPTVRTPRSTRSRF
ncbi:unnamed protein product [Microthlaspi erraticum]|uniref:Uncharacterized protein n=1 Tax=Microthlaspi erraticum TaxID=1685480 RepID=A0A6D2IWF9_9BRAS|nr:unnamed protein product [Microthlaspi erraticum]